MMVPGISAAGLLAWLPVLFGMAGPGQPTVTRMIVQEQLIIKIPVRPHKVRRHQHPGAEFIYVLSGTLSLHIGDEEHTMEARDSIYFDSTVPHGYRKSGGKACCARVVSTG